MSESEPNKLFILIPIAALVGMVLFSLFIVASGTNPDSIWCSYKIYKQADGSYEVWSAGKWKHLEFSAITYEEAKSFQVKRCLELREFLSSRPNGNRVK